jgi:hypothetical protein
MRPYIEILPELSTETLSDMIKTIGAIAADPIRAADHALETESDWAAMRDAVEAELSKRGVEFVPVTW